MNNGYEAILFDFDGVLVDSEPLHYECWCEILKPFGFDLDWDTYARNCIGITDRAMLEKFAADVGPPVTLERLLAEYPRKKALFREKMTEVDLFLPETVELLKSLSGYKMAVVSSSSRGEVQPSLERYGVMHLFGATVFGWEGGKLKPAPDPYIKAGELLGVKRALVVEDSDAGVASGAGAGFDVLRVANPGEVAEKVRAALTARPERR